MRAADEMNVQIPRDLSVMGFDNREFSDYLIPRITTMDLPLHEIGFRAMESLAHLIKGEQVERRPMPMCKLIERESVDAPRGR
jgi:LacI family transcriptional regulator